MLILLSTTAFAGALMGLDYSPFGKGDLAWSGSTSASELAFAENEGLIRPNLQPWVGYRSLRRPHSHQFEVNVMSHRMSTFYAEDQYMTQRMQVIRMGYAFRRHFPQPDSAVNPYIRVGSHFNLPRVKQTSTAYTKAEAADVDLATKEIATQLAGTGVSFGGGIRYAIQPGLYIGARWDFNIHVTNFITEEGAVALDVFSETAGLFCIEWQLKNKE